MIRNKVLYFPYINVPDSSWFTRMLLYWDEVGAIIPREFIIRPKTLGEHTRSFVEANLVKQIMPGQFIHNTPNFDSTFSEFLEQLGDNLESRRQSFSKNEISLIHIEKLANIGKNLIEQGLARRSKDSYTWYEVETKTASDFMTYLAIVLSNNEDLMYMPVTDTLETLQQYVNTSHHDLNPETKISKLRLQILENVFPSPKQSLTASEIELFKNKHGDKLSKFRNTIEKEIIEITNIEDKSLQNRRLELFSEEINDSAKEIKAKFNEFGYKYQTVGKIASLALSEPFAPPIIRNALSLIMGKDKNIEQEPFLYAAYAQNEVLE